MRTKVKICGITNLADAARAVTFGADYLGFNFYSGSPRYIAPEEARRIIRRLPRRVKAVGVFVDAQAGQIIETAKQVGLRIVQLHGNESPRVVALLAKKCAVWKAIRVRGALRRAQIRKYGAAQALLLERQHVTLENLFKRIESGSLKEVRIILKVDVKGSLEVLKEALPGLSTEEVKLRLLHASVGTVGEGDVLLADASDAIIIGFHVDAEARAQDLAKERGVEIRLYTVIYQAIDEMKAALEGLLEPELVEARQGQAGVKEVFRISRVGTIAGCMVTNGKIERSHQVRLIRDGKVVHTGKLESLKRFKDDVKEVVEGYECGIKVAGHDDVRKGDIIEAFAIQKIARKLEKK